MPKLTIEFNDRVNGMLEELAEEAGTTKVDIIRRALALYKHVDDEVRETDKRKLATTENGNVVTEIVWR